MIASTDERRLGEQLNSGFYMVEVRLRTASHASASRPFALVMELIPHDGTHQGDHTVAYTVEQSLSPPGAPGTLVYDLLNEAMADGVRTWNVAGGGTSGRWPYISFCENSCPENTDGYTVRVVVEPTNHCQRASACAGLLDEGGGDRHLRNSTIYIEYPPLDLNGRRRWTDDPDLNGKLVDNAPGVVRVRWIYLPTAVLHELGHVIGLIDLYGIAGFANSSAYLMGDGATGTMTHVPHHDIRYLNLIYWKHGHR